MKRIFCLLIIATLTLSGCGNQNTEETVESSSEVSVSVSEPESAETIEETPESTEESSAPLNDYPVDEEAFTLTSVEFASLLKAGWNLGNTLDAQSFDGLKAETAWNMPKAKKELFDSLKEQGFTSIRLPISWGYHTSGTDYEIDPEWMARVKEVVDWAIDDGFYVIIDSHHDNYWYYPSEDHLDKSLHFIECIWSQIADEFRDYDEHLIFEGMNEPRLEDTDLEWYFDKGNEQGVEALRCIEKLDRKFVDTVRASGGNNTLRYLLLSCYAGNPDITMDNNYQIASDPANHLLLSVHAYTPYDFAMNPSGYTDWDESKDTELSFMDRLNETYIQSGIGVAITEMGAVNKANLEDRVRWCTDYTAKAASLGISCFQWDNGNNGIGEECFAFVSRKTFEPLYPDLLEAFIGSYNN